ncbi:MAG: sulfotransferase domain-containing protein [Spartobacteria bacterium]
MFFQSKQSTIDRLDFIIAGTQKGGTSALHYHVDQHPNITMAHSEEAHMIDHPRRHFFDDERRFAGKVNYEILHDGIELKPKSLAVGSCTPIYIYWKPAMERIRNYHPAIKLIVLLRNPIDRAFSQWNMNWDRQRETLGFREAIAAEIQEKETSPSLQSRRRSYVDRGYYFEQMERVFRFFPRAQVRVIKFEEFRKRTAETVNEVFRFLGLEPLAKIRNREQNQIPYEKKITPEERQYLYRLYEDDINRLEDLLGWDCSDWKEG